MSESESATCLTAGGSDLQNRKKKRKHKSGEGTANHLKIQITLYQRRKKQRVRNKSGFL